MSVTDSKAYSSSAIIVETERSVNIGLSSTAASRFFLMGGTEGTESPLVGFSDPE